MKKQNTLVICLSENNGGMELASLKITSILKNSINVTLLARDNSFISNNATSYGVDIKTVSKSSNLSFLLYKQVRNFIIKNNIKNVIFLGASELKTLYFSFIGLDINLIVRQGTYKKTSKKDLFHRLIYSKVNYFVGNSKYILESVKNVIPLAKHTKLKVIYASHQINDNSYDKKDNTCINIIHLGRVVDGKGQKDAIIACNKLQNENIDFKCFFYGGIEDQKYYLELIEYINKNNLSKKIFFKGHSDNIESILSNSDVFLFPSKGEGFSNAMIEAISNGLVIIAYDNSSIPEMKEFGFHINLVKDQDVELLSSKLLSISENITKELKCSLKNITLVQNIFSVNRERDEYLKLLL